MSDLPAPPPAPHPEPPPYPARGASPTGWPTPGESWASGTGEPPVPVGPMPLAPTVIALWRLQGLGYALGITAATLTVTGLAGLQVTPALALTGAVLAIAVGLAVWLPAVAHRRWRYELTDDTLELAHGVVVHTESTIPHFRVQHVDVHQGPIERWLGIARLEIATASSATDAELPGIEIARAEPIRRHVLERSQSGDGV